MNKITKKEIHELRDFLILWSTQSLSGLGSSMTAFALALWLYQQTGSALKTAMLTIFTYVPYVLVSLFAGALIDRFDKKKTMLICDLFAAVCSMIVFVLYRTDHLMIWHLYALNIISGLMNTIQQPTSEVATTLVVPEKHYQRISGLESFSRSMISILNPLIATALFAFAGLDLVIAVDLVTFAIAFFSLLCFIQIPEEKAEKEESVIQMTKEGFAYLRKTPLILTLILFLSGVNFTASAFDAVLPGLVIPNPKGGMGMLGVITSCAGIAMAIGSVIVTVMPKPKDRVKVVYYTMLFSLGTENFLLGLTRNPIIWCFGQFLGWIVVPIMSANLNVIMRTTIPVEFQGRVYACRNSLQFFTIPIGLFFGGYLVDDMCEPWMAQYTNGGTWNLLFGSGKGSGAALAMFILGVLGVVITLVTGQFLKKYKYIED